MEIDKSSAATRTTASTVSSSSSRRKSKRRKRMVTRQDSVSAVDNASDIRQICRINCGADIVIPNIIPFLDPFDSDREDEDDYSSSDENSSLDYMSV